MLRLSMLVSVPALYRANTDIMLKDCPAYGSSARGRIVMTECSAYGHERIIRDQEEEEDE